MRNRDRRSGRQLGMLLESERSRPNRGKKLRAVSGKLAKKVDLRTIDVDEFLYADLGNDEDRQFDRDVADALGLTPESSD